MESPNVTIKSAKVDKGGGGRTLIHKMWIKGLFFNPSLTKLLTSVFSAAKTPLGHQSWVIQIVVATSFCQSTDMKES